MGVPGCPDWARSTASMARARTELMLRHATSAGKSNARDDGVGSGRTIRLRELLTFRKQLLSEVRPGRRWEKEDSREGGRR